MFSELNFILAIAYWKNSQMIFSLTSLWIHFYNTPPPPPPTKEPKTGHPQDFETAFEKWNSHLEVYINRGGVDIMHFYHRVLLLGLTCC